MWLGENGAKYKNPELEAELAMELLKLLGQSHLQVQGVNYAPIATLGSILDSGKFQLVR